MSIEPLKNLLARKSGLVGACVISLIILVAIFASFIAPYDPVEADFANQLKGPCKAHLLGTDEMGRDILSRIIFGSRISIVTGVCSVIISLVFGGIIGLLAGYYAKWFDHISMRIMDLMMAFPYLLLALLILATFGSGTSKVIITIGIVYVPVFARITRGSVLTVKEQGYVEAIVALGATDLRILFRHVLLNAFPPLLVQSTLCIGYAIINSASLSFLGLGTEPPTPDWGLMMSMGREYIRDASWLITFPGIAILITVIGFNLLGDGLRDSLDPRMRE
jgi:peptide/nickel transport system permease protein